MAKSAPDDDIMWGTGGIDHSVAIEDIDAAITSKSVYCVVFTPDIVQYSDVGKINCTTTI